MACFSFYSLIFHQKVWTCVHTACWSSSGLHSKKSILLSETISFLPGILSEQNVYAPVEMGLCFALTKFKKSYQMIQKFWSSSKYQKESHVISRKCEGILQQVWEIKMYDLKYLLCSEEKGHSSIDSHSVWVHASVQVCVYVCCAVCASRQHLEHRL